MPPLLLISLVLILSSLAYWQGRRRAFALSTQPSAVKMHSRPGYYGMLTALWCALPALLIVAVWQLAADPLLTQMAIKGVAATKGTLSPDQLNLLVNDMRNLVGGEIPEYSKMLAESREQALDRMVEAAHMLGADAVLATRFTTVHITPGAAEILVYGTAVRLADD